MHLPFAQVRIRLSKALRSDPDPGFSRRSRLVKYPFDRQLACAIVLSSLDPPVWTAMAAAIRRPVRLGAGAGASPMGDGGKCSLTAPCTGELIRFA